MTPGPHVLMPGAVVPTLAQYGRALHAARLSLDRLAISPSTGGNVASIQSALRALGRVRLPDGRELHTQTPLLARELAPDPGSVETVRRQLDVLDDALRASSVRGTSPARLALLDQVLRDPRFHPRATLLQQLAEWLNSLLSRLPRPGVPPLPLSPPAVVVAAIFLALVLAAAILLARGTVARLVPSGALSPGEARRLRAAESGQAAVEHADRGDYRTALRYLFLSTMLTLQERDVIELEPSLTNREYLSRLRAGPGTEGELRAPLLALVDLFDRVWYGHDPLDAPGFARARELARRAIEAAGKSREAA